MEKRVKNKFFTRQVCDCALLAQTLLYAQNSAEMKVSMKTQVYISDQLKKARMYEASAQTLDQLCIYFGDRITPEDLW
ncbi:MAG: hypothetical protein LUI12_07675 [Clostridiales bacterium]|nr:hypothetical protein [Clostridiales bacterium]